MEGLSATALYDRALLIQPRHVEALVSRAGILFDSGRVDEADADVRKIREYSTWDPLRAFLGRR